MKATTVAFFNNKGGVGKTSLVYHLSWMFADLGVRVIAADFDPQANLTAAFLSEDELEQLWNESGDSPTIYGAIEPSVRGTGDIRDDAPLQEFDSNLRLLAGDLRLSRFEDQLSEAWPRCMSEDERAFRSTTAMWRVLQLGAEAHQAAIALIDLGPNLGALNRASLVAADWVVVPLAPDLCSLQGLSNLGPALKRWRRDWTDRRGRGAVIRDLEMPGGEMRPAGYVVLQHSIRADRPTKAYERWIRRIPNVYRTNLLEQPEDDTVTVENDPNALALLKHYRTLMALSHEARKPIFRLTAADGATGAHYTSARNAADDFERLARNIAGKIGLAMPTTGQPALF